MSNLDLELACQSHYASFWHKTSKGNSEARKGTRSVSPAVTTEDEKVEDSYTGIKSNRFIEPEMTPVGSVTDSMRLNVEHRFQKVSTVLQELGIDEREK